MKKMIFLFTAMICLLAVSNQAEAQLIIRNNGHAQENPLMAFVLQEM